MSETDWRIAASRGLWNEAVELAASEGYNYWNNIHEFQDFILEISPFEETGTPELTAIYFQQSGITLRGCINSLVNWQWLTFAARDNWEAATEAAATQLGWADVDGHWLRFVVEQLAERIEKHDGGVGEKARYLLASLLTEIYQQDHFWPVVHEVMLQQHSRIHGQEEVNHVKVDPGKQEEVQEFWNTLRHDNNNIIKYSPATGNHWMTFILFSNDRQAEKKGVLILRTGIRRADVEGFLRDNLGFRIEGSGSCAKLKGGGAFGPGRIAIKSSFERRDVRHRFKEWVSNKKLVFDREELEQLGKESQSLYARALDAGIAHIAAGALFVDEVRVKRREKDSQARRMPEEFMPEKEYGRKDETASPELPKEDLPYVAENDDSVRWNY
ncbi:hypothetical protein JHN49_30755 [Streptomyces sp. MBT57]|nr:hypothetical protein [Streptomyces sp. MBT57]